MAQIVTTIATLIEKPVTRILVTSSLVTLVGKGVIQKVSSSEGEESAKSDGEGGGASLFTKPSDIKNSP